MASHSLPGSALYQRHAGDDAKWTVEAQLLAAAVDELRVLAWQYVCAHTPKGKRQPTAPKPIPRPGVDSTPQGEGTKHLGSEPIPMSEWASWWASGGGEAA